MLFRIQSSKFKILCLALFLFVRLNAQFYQLKNYNVKDGLPSSEVYAMMQDASGYLWFTTDMGVSRFNGYEFKNFSTENGLADNTNFGLIQDMKGRIWFRSFSGKLSYYENGEIKTPACNSGITKLLDIASLTSLYVDEGDTIWAGLDKNKILKISPPWQIKNTKIINLQTTGAYLFLFNEDNFIYGGFATDLWDITVYNKTFTKLYTVPIHLQAVEHRGMLRFTYSLLKDHSYLVTADNLVARFNSKGIISQKTTSSVFICTLEEEGQDLLTGTYDGAGYFTDYSFTDGGAFALDKKIITAICRDHENGLWLCTEGNGVFYLPFRNFLYYTPNDGLSESKISCATKAGSKIICGHLDGTLSILERQNVKSIRFNIDTSVSSSSNRTTSLAYDGNNKTYISTVKNIFTLDMDKLAVEKILAAGSKSIIFSDDTTMWSLQFRRLVKFSTTPSLNTISSFGLPFYSDNIFHDRSDNIWICAAYSMWTSDGTSRLTDEGKNVPLLNARFVGVQQDQQGNIWMVSRGNGVVIKKGNNYFSITQKNGLSGNMCRTLFIDSGNVVWIGTNNGLSKIEVLPGDEFKYSITTYSSKNGLLTNEVNDILRHDNKLWLIHNNGVSVFDPGHIRDNKNPPPVYITGLMINDDSIVPVNMLQVSHDRNYFNISFIGLSYKDPGHIEYRYKMEGIDSNWIYTSYTSVKYQTLPPGNYRFVVYAKNNDGYWSIHPAIFSFTILPAWWQTWIFKIAIAFILLVVIFFVFRFRLEVIRKRDQKKALLQTRIAGIELNALRAQMNPHFVFNSINSVQYFITNNDPDSSQKYLSKFAKLIRYVVDNSKLTSIPVLKEIEALTLYLELEALRFGKHFEFEIRVHPNVDTAYTQIPSMLIQPYVENSIWHGIMHKEGNGKIIISLEMKGDVLYCIVEDNGIGRQRSIELKRRTESLYRSVGMSNTRERLEIINQVNKSDMSVVVSDLLNTKGEVCGTKVEIHIPIR
jgi:ligand-binding sensor domain-containing protein